MMRTRNFLCVVVVLAGCGGSVSQISLESELAKARTNWAAQKLRSYKFTIQRSCFCPDEYTRAVTITVRDGVPTDAPPHLAAYSTVDKVLDTVTEAHASKADRLEVEFTPEGWPRTVYVDQSARIADEEYGLTLTDVTAL
jgi:Family of unknown function (DUF6174)